MWEQGSHCYGNKHNSDRKEASTGHNLKQKLQCGGQNALIDWLIVLTEVQRNTLFHFSGHTCEAHFPHVKVGKVVVTNGNTAAQRQWIKT